MEITVSTQNARVPVTIMHVEGNIDSSTYQTFQARAEELIRDGARHLLIDLTNVPYVSSAGFRALHQLFNELRSLHADYAGSTGEEIKKGISAGTYKSPHLKLLNLSKETKTTFEMSGFDMFIEAHNDVKAALASF